MNIFMAKKEKLPFPKNPPKDLWRTHSDSVNKGLLFRWWPVDEVENLLKTDLFDEAVNEGLYPFMTARLNHVFGMDISFPVVYQTKLRYSGFQTMRADLRCLPFLDNSFDLIVSNSTLDHFASIKEMIGSLRELHRVLRSGKHALLTLDNLANPIILLRSILPFKLLNRIGIVPYCVGRTMGPSLLRDLLETSGFKVLEMDTLVHCPRMVSVAIARWMQKYASPKVQKYFLRFLQAHECLSHLPTRFLTGYFIAVKVMKR